MNNTLSDFLTNTFQEAFRRFHEDEEEGYSSKEYYDDLTRFYYGDLHEICHDCPSSKKYVEEFGMVNALRLYHTHYPDADMLCVLADEDCFYAKLLEIIALWANGDRDTYEKYKEYCDKQ
jgi:hypothetical protein